MKKLAILLLVTLLGITSSWAQNTISGYCGNDVKWDYDGLTLTITNVSKKGLINGISDYDLKKFVAPWISKKYSFKKLVIGQGINRIGSCAFANCTSLQEVVFEGNDVVEIAWGAFMGCNHLRTISLPFTLRTIGTIAFANCSALTSVKIPDQCRVGEQAFVSCTNLKSLEISPTAILGPYVFASEVNIDGHLRHSLYSGEVRRAPSYVNLDNCHEYGFAKSTIEKFSQNNIYVADYDYLTCDVDSMIPTTTDVRNSTYALIIGNQNYRFVSNVPYAIHDARVFADYCKKTLGIPSENIHLCEDATKQMIIEEELEDWISNIPARDEKNLIVYYAGHGVPDTKDPKKVKPYLLPTDVRGSNPRRGIALDEFYTKLGDLAFNQTSVFLDACFSGVNRENDGVTEGLRAVAIDVEEEQINSGNLVIFSAAQGNEPAQGYPEMGHGLFTYYLLKEIQTTGGVLNYGDLSDQLNNNVNKKSNELKLHQKQTPTTTTSDNAGDYWRFYSF